LLEQDEWGVSGDSNLNNFSDTSNNSAGGSGSHRSTGNRWRRAGDHSVQEVGWRSRYWSGPECGYEWYTGNHAASASKEVGG
jgi:hypothetical protein